MKKPFVLAPAGSFDALVAAVNAGADEVYFGLGKFNARYNAKNFDDEELKRALEMCRILGVKSNITMNTLVTDKEMPEVLSSVYSAACLGADAFIVQDLGLAREIKKNMPEVVLHASTQCACHNSDGAEYLSSLGFSRVVLAREMPKHEIEKVVKLGIETEIFVHGALCVCHSGMCLMSSVIGKRSGNRGLCAQPCRLPYSIDGERNVSYPLSLKDLSLSSHIEDIYGLGVTSLKIEGRMKSPEYVYKTTKMWRELIDGGRNATSQQIKELENIFSRGGFTDRYFTGTYTSDNRNMYGIRDASDKANTRESEKAVDMQECERKRRISLDCTISEGDLAEIIAECGEYRINTKSEFVCPTASSRPVTGEEIKASLSKLGGTLFFAEPEDIKVTVKGRVFLSKAMLNSIRRDAVSALEKMMTAPVSVSKNDFYYNTGKRKKIEKREIFVSCKSPDKVSEIKRADYVSVPIITFGNEEKSEKVIDKAKKLGAKLGVRMPRVIFDSEKETCLMLLSKAKACGADFCEISNVGQINLVKQSGLSLFGGIGLNVFNSSSVKAFEEAGFELLTLSPELNEAQIRDVYVDTNDVKLCAFVKGNLPIMVLESCIFKANGSCRNKDCTEKYCGYLHDRIGMDFQVYAEPRLGADGKSCRNVIYNSIMTDVSENSAKLEKMNADVTLILL